MNTLTRYNISQTFLSTIIGVESYGYLRVLKVRPPPKYRFNSLNTLLIQSIKTFLQYKRNLPFTAIQQQNISLFRPSLYKAYSAL